MAGKKNSRLVTMELDLEAYKIKNKSLSEYLVKVQQEKAQAYQQLNTLNKQYWKLHRKYCSIKNLVQHNMRNHIALLTNFQEKIQKSFMEENDTTTESSMKSSRSQNLSVSSLNIRSRQSALNSNDDNSDSLSEGICRVVTTRKKYNSDKENSSRVSELANENVSPTENGIESTAQMADVQANIRNRRGTAKDPHSGVERSDQELWDVDVHLRADTGDSNIIEGLASSDEDDEEEDGEDDKLDTIQEEDEYNYWSASAKRLKLMVTERKLSPATDADADSSMACQIDESIIDRTNATFLTRDSVSPLERRRRMANKFISTVSPSTMIDDNITASTARGTAPANLSDDCPDLSNCSRSFMMKSLNLQDTNNADVLRNDISFLTSTPFGVISPKTRGRSEAESGIQNSPFTIVNRALDANSSDSRSATVQPKRMFIENYEGEKETAETSDQCIGKPDAEPCSSGIRSKSGSSKKLENSVFPVQQMMSSKMKSKTKNCGEKEESNNEIKNGTAAMTKSCGTRMKAVSVKDVNANRKVYNNCQNAADWQSNTPSDEQQCQEKEIRSENTPKICQKSNAKKSASSELKKGTKSKARSDAKIENTTDASEDELALTENQVKYKCTKDTSGKVQSIPANSRKRIQSPSKNNKAYTVRRKPKSIRCDNKTETESSCDDSSPSETEEIKKSTGNDGKYKEATKRLNPSAEVTETTASKRDREDLKYFNGNDTTDADLCSRDEGAGITTSNGDETLTEADNVPKQRIQQRGLRTKERSGGISSEPSKKVIKVMLDRIELDCSTATNGKQVQQQGQVIVKMNEEKSIFNKTPGHSEQPSSSTVTKVKRLKKVPRSVEMRSSPRPSRAARPCKTLCEPSLNKKMRRSK